MPTVPPNCGFATGGPAGWVRLWLKNDNQSGPGVDLWASPGQFYPLQVAKYELLESGPHPSSLSFNETDDLGGYTRSQQLDEFPYSDLPTNAGAYSGGNGSIEITTPEGTVTASLVQGDFFAGAITGVAESASVTYLFLVKP